MEKIIITIETDNSAFDPDPGYELARILKQVSYCLENGRNPESINIMDINGNCVGRIEVK